MEGDGMKWNTNAAKSPWGASRTFPQKTNSHINCHYRTDQFAWMVRNGTGSFGLVSARASKTMR